jgi:hypothetical protein
MILFSAFPALFPECLRSQSRAGMIPQSRDDRSVFPILSVAHCTSRDNDEPTVSRNSHGLPWLLWLLGRRRDRLGRDNSPGGRGVVQ